MRVVPVENILAERRGRQPVLCYHEPGFRIVSGIYKKTTLTQVLKISGRNIGRMKTINCSHLNLYQI